MVRHTVQIVTVVDRCSFDALLVRRAFTDAILARQWGVEECDRRLNEHPEDDRDWFDPSYEVMEVEYA